VASDAGQARPGCVMVKAWTGVPCVAAPMDYQALKEDFTNHTYALPQYHATPVPGWIPLDEKEARIAAETGTRVRPNSMLVYLKGMIQGGRSTRPALPPEDLRTPSL